MTAPDAATQAAKLRQAARAVTEAGEYAGVLDASDGRPLAVLSPSLARPLAAVLLGAAFKVETAGTHIGQGVMNALEIAGLVLHEDLGGNGATG